MKKRFSRITILLIFTAFLFVFPFVYPLIPSMDIHAESYASDMSEELYNSVKSRIIQAIENHETSLSFSKGELTLAQFQKVYEDVTNSKYFYIANGFSAANNTDGSLAYVTISYKFSESEIKLMKSRFNRAIADFKSEMHPGMSDLEKIAYINYYICRNCMYDPNLNNENKNPNDYDAYGCLVDHIAVCDGYSKAFKVLASEVGIECHVVSSSKLNHAWNMVKLNGKYYMIDSTWNDGEADIYSDIRPYNRYYFFLKSCSWFNSGQGQHKPSEFDYKVESYGMDATYASDTRYETGIWEDVSTNLVYVNGVWYNLDKDDIRIREYSCNGTDFIASSQNEINLSLEKWVIDETYFYAANFCCRLTSYQNYLYYITPKSIWRVNSETKEVTQISGIPSDSQVSDYNNLYGINITRDGTLQYLIASDLNNDAKDGTVYTARLSNLVPDETSPVITLSIGDEEWWYISTDSPESISDGSAAALSIEDSGDIAGVYYFLSKDVYNKAELAALSDSNWTEIKDINAFDYTKDTVGEYYLYVKAVDASGNAGYTSTGKLIIDRMPPNIADGVTEFYGGAEITITDDHLDKVYVNGIETALDGGKLKLSISDSAYVIEAIDNAGNKSIAEISVLPYTYEPVFTWAADYSSASVAINCLQDNSKSVTVNNATITSQITDATCVASGKKVLTASVSFEGNTYSDTKEVTINAKGHIEVTDNAVPATKDKSGLTAGSHCSVCGAVIKAQQEVPYSDDSTNNGGNNQSNGQGDSQSDKQNDQNGSGNNGNDQNNNQDDKQNDQNGSGNNEKNQNNNQDDKQNNQDNDQNGSGNNGNNQNNNQNNNKDNNQNDNQNGQGNDGQGGGNQDPNNGGTTENAIPTLEGIVHGDLETGLWVELADGTYPTSMWAMVNGVVYYFDAEGYAAANEYAGGVWFDGNGQPDATYTMEWKCNSTGFWIVDSSGWFPKDRWLRIDGNWYFFDEEGYMASEEWRDGFWLGESGALDYDGVLSWKCDTKGWWVEDDTGWYPYSCWQKINGSWYYFKADGYMATGEYVDGYWIDDNGVCQ